MDRNSFSTRLGDNIRAARQRRRMSSEQLADKLSERGIMLSGRGIRNYESGDREMSVDLLIQIACCLECSVQTLLDGLDPRVTDNSEALEHNMLTPDEHRVFRYMATKWTGDRHALIVFNALYMALPKQYRREAPLSLMLQAEQAIRDGAVSLNDLPEELQYMEDRWRELYK